MPDDLVVVDVGCRWGFGAHWEQLGSHVTLIGFDADESEIARLREEFAAHPRMHFVARTLGSEPGTTTLIHAAEPGSNSLFSRASRLRHIPDYAGSRVTGESAVAVTTLDSWLQDEGRDRIDSLKLDVQGAELDVLRGAENSLRATRHVEVEVSFNELFAGAPLFGEIDALLRAHGFVLWRFRDLVHHALRGVGEPPPVTEHLWYESVPQPLTVRGGQLMWCNAHFVREDMYDPSVRLSWVTRLRDACITSALSFHDLAILNVMRLAEEPDCPATVRDRARGLVDRRAAAYELGEVGRDRPRRSFARRPRAWWARLHAPANEDPN